MRHCFASGIRRAARGQALVEFVLVVVFLFGITFFLVDATRLWLTHLQARDAAYEGALVASQTHSVGAGFRALRRRMSQAGLEGFSQSVVPVMEGKSYTAQLSVTYEPLFTLPGFSVFPAQIITYREVVAPASF